MNTLPPSKAAGILSFCAAVPTLGILYVLLFVGQPECESAIDGALKIAHYFLFEEETTRYWFYWLLFTPLASIALATSYIAGLAKSKTGALILFFATVALCISSFFLLNFAVAFVLALPCYWGYLCVRQA